MAECFINIRKVKRIDYGKKQEKKIKRSCNKRSSACGSLDTLGGIDVLSAASGMEYPFLRIMAVSYPCLRASGRAFGISTDGNLCDECR